MLLLLENSWELLKSKKQLYRQIGNLGMIDVLARNLALATSNREESGHATI